MRTTSLIAGLAFSASLFSVCDAWANDPPPAPGAAAVLKTARAAQETHQPVRPLQPNRRIAAAMLLLASTAGWHEGATLVESPPRRAKPRLRANPATQMLRPIRHPPPARAETVTGGR